MKQHDQSNVRPGRSFYMSFIRSIFNSFRTFFYFTLRVPWVRRQGLVRIPWNVQLWSPHKDITLGDKVQFGPYSLIHCDASLGNNVLIARSVSFIGRDDHRIDIVGKTIWNSPRGDNYKTYVEDDVWIGHGAIILSGVRIGRGSIVAAGSIVNKDIPPYSIAAGVPAKVVSKRFNETQIKEHESILNYSDRCF